MIGNSGTMESGIEAVSVLPGRVRWRVPLIRDTPAAADALLAELRTLAGIQRVDASPITAGVLVLFDESQPFDAISRDVTARVTIIAARFPRAAAAAPKAAASDTAESDWLPTAALAGLGIAALSAVSATLGGIALMAGAAVAVASGVARASRELNEESGTELAKDPGALLWHRYGGEMVRPAITSFVMRVLDLLPPFFVGVAVDIVSTGSSAWIASLGITTVGGQLVLLATLALVAAGLSAWLEYWQSRLWHRLSQRIRYDFRMEAYRHVQTLDLAYIEGRNSGELLNLFIDDVDKVAQFFDSGANEMMQAATSIIIPLLALFVLPWWIGLLVLLPIPFTIASSLWFQRKIGQEYEQVRVSADRLALELLTNLNGMVTIKSFTAENRVALEIDEATGSLRERNASANRIVALFNPVMRTWVVLGFDLLLLFGGIFASGASITVGLFAAMVYVSLRMWYPLTRLGDDFDEFMHGRAALARIRALLDQRPAIEGGDRVLIPTRAGAELTFDDVSFAYPGVPSTLDTVSFSVGPGETLAVVGPSGSGKTTIVKLLLRFYESNAGRASIDGIDVRTLTLESLRDAISLVTQDAYLFHGTVRENIAMGREDATMDEVIAAARVAMAHDFISTMPDGYETVVGERGVRLSGGERQRIAIARAVLKNAPILVLDEATSAIDSRTEAALLDALEQVTLGRTKLVIAHRLSTVRNASEILVLKDGAVWERGTHDSLLEAGGLYAAFWRLQAE